jgi:SutA RNAP-binding domain
MITKPLTSAVKSKKGACETSLTIEEQTKAFIAAGGKVEEIDSGAGGKQNMTPQNASNSGNKG